MPHYKTLFLHDFHSAHKAKFVPFAGFSMPLHYAKGIIAEHTAIRTNVGLFDVSHMAQIVVTGNDAHAFLDRVFPIDSQALDIGRQCYTLLTNSMGGIIDDAIVARYPHQYVVVVNASRSETDWAHLINHAHDFAHVDLHMCTDRTLLALQGQNAETVLGALVAEACTMRFMDTRNADWQGYNVWIARAGYTGEDGFEISLPNATAYDFITALLAQGTVTLAGLGARDSLRLEAGLPLYGADINETTTPLAARLGWSINKSRRNGGARAGGFVGADVILHEYESPPQTVRVGLLPETNVPLRTECALFANTDKNPPQVPIGKITSGCFSPTLKRPIAMGYVTREHAKAGTRLYGERRGQMHPLLVSKLPFYTPRYKRADA